MTADELEVRIAALEREVRRLRAEMGHAGAMAGAATFEVLSEDTSESWEEEEKNQ